MATTTTEPTTQPPSLREQALARLKAKRDFHAHLIVYVLVNALLWGVWAITGAGFPWPVFPTAGWGIGVAFNAWDVYGRKPITEADVEEEMRRLRSQ